MYKNLLLTLFGSLGATLGINGAIMYFQKPTTLTLTLPDTIYIKNKDDDKLINPSWNKNS